MAGLWRRAWLTEEELGGPLLYLASTQRSIPHDQVPLDEWTLVEHPALPMRVYPRLWEYVVLAPGVVELSSPPFSFEWSADQVVTYWLIYSFGVQPPQLFFGERIFDPVATIPAGDVLGFTIKIMLSDHGPPCPE